MSALGLHRLGVLARSWGSPEAIYFECSHQSRSLRDHGGIACRRSTGSSINRSPVGDE